MKEGGRGSLCLSFQGFGLVLASLSQRRVAGGGGGGSIVSETIQVVVTEGRMWNHGKQVVLPYQKLCVCAGPATRT